MKRRYLSLIVAAVMLIAALGGCSSSGSSGSSSGSEPSSSAETEAATAAGNEDSGAEAAAGSGEIVPASDTIKIALVTPLSGDNATYGVKQQNGYLLAMDEINSSGGVYGAKLVLESYDDGGDPATAASGTQKYVDDPEVMVLGGCCLTSCTAAMLPITGDAGLAQMVVSSSARSLTGISDCFFRMAVQDAAVGPQIANQFTNMGDTAAVALYPNNDFGTGLMESFCEQFEANGGDVLDAIPYNASDQDFSAILTTVKSLNPDCIALCGTTTDGALIIKQARQMGIEAPIMGQPGLYNQNVIDIAGEAAEGLLACGVFVATDPDEKCQEFVQKYVAAYNETPDGFAALAYDQIYVIADAAARAMEANDGELTRASMVDALRETDYEGVTGTVNFDENGDWVRDYLTVTVINGEYDLYQPE